MIKKNQNLIISIKIFFRHLTYPQVQKCLPLNLPRAQSTFFRVVSNINIKINKLISIFFFSKLYDITSETTYFGLQEFYATVILIDMVAKQE